jgi:ABC-type phosphate/phosphonate transport system substrate-binding protein
MRTTYRLGGISLLLLFLAFPTSAFSDDTRPIRTDKDQLVLGVLPFVSPERLARRFEPLALYLSGKLGVEIRLETAPNYGEFVKRTAEKNRYDILLRLRISTIQRNKTAGIVQWCGYQGSRFTRSSSFLNQARYSP